MNTDRKKSSELLKKVEGLGYKAIMFTVDTAVMGNRERGQFSSTLSHFFLNKGDPSR